MTKVIEKIYHEIEGKEISYGTELVKKEYTHCKTRALKEMSGTIQALITGKTKEELEKKGGGKKAFFGKMLGIGMFLMLGARFIYTKK